MRGTLILLFTCVTLLRRADCGKILAVNYLNVKCHFIVFEALIKELDAKGHQVVVLNHFPQKEPVPNYTDIDVSGTALDITDNITIAMALKWRTLASTDFIWRDTRVTCQAAMNHPKAQALLKSTESFVLVVTEIFGSECSVAFARKFKAPLINVITSVAVPWAHGRIGNPDHPAYIPNYFLPYTNKMNFWQRLTNTVYHVILNVGNTIYSYNPTSTLMKSYFGEDVPSVEQLVSNASLVIVNSHLSINGPRPTVPAFVEVEGMHIQKPKELSQVLQEFFDKSTHGVVYFNLGSLVQVQTLPPEKLEALLDAFGALPESVLMKYTGESLPGKPENVMTSKLFPQLDVLNHPKTKVFISHGGLGSTHETVYAGVPVVGIHLFADQEANINAILEKGMATKLYYEDITKDTLLQAIRTVIDNPSYSENAKRVSALFRDRPMTAIETAVYWVEYVIRHRGAPHLRSAAADMPLYQYLLLDVIGVLLLISVTCFYAIFYLLKYLFRTLTCGDTAQPLTKSKHE